MTVRPSARRLVLAALLFAPSLSATAQDSAGTHPDSARSARRTGLPLEATRSWELNTTEASWMSVDLSPDGATLVFDLLGDLYIMPVAGGAATALTSGMPFDGQPRYSPDGKHIVYVSDEDGGDNLWLMEVATSRPPMTGQVTRPRPFLIRLGYSSAGALYLNPFRSRPSFCA